MLGQPRQRSGLELIDLAKHLLDGFHAVNFSVLWQVVKALAKLFIEFAQLEAAGSPPTRSTP